METLGRHVLVEFFNCDANIMNDVRMIEQGMVAAAENGGATVINSTFHHFSPIGVSGVVVIQESHLAIHSWPEYGYAAVDLFTCGDEINPWVSFDYLKEVFKSQNYSALEMRRGSIDQLKRQDVNLDEMREEVKQQLQDGKFNRNVWFTERNDGVAFSLQHTGDMLFRELSPFQKVEVFKTYAYGNMLTLDDKVMCTEKDEYAYHEMLVHVPMMLHPKAKRILIIGGGDGGTAREVLRYEVDEVVMIEIDEAVVRASREHLPSISSALDHPKLDLQIADGIKFVNEADDESFDGVFVDSTDPIGPGEGLFTYDFYENVKRILKPDGFLVAQSESPMFNREVFRDIVKCYRDIFGEGHVHSYLSFIPTYPSGMWSFAMASRKEINPLNSFNELDAGEFVKKHELQYYNTEVHKASFALPNFVTNILHGQEAAVKEL